MSRIQSENKFSNGVSDGVGTNRMCFVVILDGVIPIDFHSYNIIYYTAKSKVLLMSHL